VKAGPELAFAAVGTYGTRVPECVRTAFALLPLSGPGEINSLVISPEYAWAILPGREWNSRFGWQPPRR
jgi:hypothetical protein